MDNWLTTEDAAKELGLEIASVQNAIRLGKIKARRFGRIWVLDKSAIEQYKTDHLGKVGRPSSKKESR